MTELDNWLILSAVGWGSVLLWKCLEIFEKLAISSIALLKLTRQQFIGEVSSYSKNKRGTFWDNSVVWLGVLASDGWKRLGNLPEGNQEPFVVKDKVRKPQVSLEWATWLAGRREGHPVCKKLGDGLMAVTVWLELCTSYYSFSCHHHLRHP